MFYTAVLKLAIPILLATQHAALVDGKNTCIWCKPDLASRFTNCIYLSIINSRTFDAIPRGTANDMKNSLMAACDAIKNTPDDMKMRIMNGALSGEMSGMVMIHSTSSRQSQSVATTQVMKVIGECYYQVTGQSHVSFVSNLGRQMEDMRDDDYSNDDGVPEENEKPMPNYDYPNPPVVMNSNAQAPQSYERVPDRQPQTFEMAPLPAPPTYNRFPNQDSNGVPDQFGWGLPEGQNQPVFDSGDRSYPKNQNVNDRSIPSNVNSFENSNNQPARPPGQAPTGQNGQNQIYPINQNSQASAVAVSTSGNNPAWRRPINSPDQDYPIVIQNSTRNTPGNFRQDNIDGGRGPSYPGIEQYDYPMVGDNAVPNNRYYNSPRGPIQNSNVDYPQPSDRNVPDSSRPSPVQKSTASSASAASGVDSPRRNPVEPGLLPGNDFNNEPIIRNWQPQNNRGPSDEQKVPLAPNRGWNNKQLQGPPSNTNQVWNNYQPQEFPSTTGGAMNNNQPQGSPSATNGGWNNNQPQGSPSNVGWNNNQPQEPPPATNGDWNKQPQGSPSTTSGSWKNNQPQISSAAVAGSGNNNQPQGAPPATGGVWNNNQPQGSPPATGGGWNNNQPQGAPPATGGGWNNHQPQGSPPATGGGWNNNQPQGSPPATDGGWNNNQPQGSWNNNQPQRSSAAAGSGNNNQPQSPSETGGGWNNNQPQRSSAVAAGSRNNNQPQRSSAVAAGSRNNNQPQQSPTATRSAASNNDGRQPQNSAPKKDAPQRGSPNNSQTNSKSGADSTNSDLKSQPVTEVPLQKSTDKKEKAKSCAMRFGETSFVYLSKSDVFGCIFGNDTTRPSAIEAATEAIRRCFNDNGFSKYSNEASKRCTSEINSLPKSSSTQAYAEKVSKSVMSTLYKHNALLDNCEDLARSMSSSIVQALSDITDLESDSNADSFPATNTYPSTTTPAPSSGKSGKTYAVSQSSAASRTGSVRQNDSDQNAPQNPTRNDSSGNNQFRPNKQNNNRGNGNSASQANNYPSNNAANSVAYTQNTNQPGNGNRQTQTAANTNSEDYNDEDCDDKQTESQSPQNSKNADQDNTSQGNSNVDRPYKINRSNAPNSNQAIAASGAKTQQTNRREPTSDWNDGNSAPQNNNYGKTNQGFPPSDWNNSAPQNNPSNNDQVQSSPASAAYAQGNGGNRRTGPYNRNRGNSAAPNNNSQTATSVAKVKNQGSKDYPTNADYGNYNYNDYSSGPSENRAKSQQGSNDYPTNGDYNYDYYGDYSVSTGNAAGQGGSNKGKSAPQRSKATAVANSQQGSQDSSANTDYDDCDYDDDSSGSSGNAASQGGSNSNKGNSAPQNQSGSRATAVANSQQGSQDSTYYDDCDYDEDSSSSTVNTANQRNSTPQSRKNQASGVSTTSKPQTTEGLERKTTSNGNSAQSTSSVTNQGSGTNNSNNQRPNLPQLQKIRPHSKPNTAGSSSDAKSNAGQTNQGPDSGNQNYPQNNSDNTNQAGSSASARSYSQQPNQESDSNGYNGQNNKVHQGLQQEVSDPDSNTRISALVASAIGSTSPNGFNYNTFTATMGIAYESIQDNHPNRTPDQNLMRMYSESIVALTEALQIIKYKKY